MIKKKIRTYSGNSDCLFCAEVVKDVRSKRVVLYVVIRLNNPSFLHRIQSPFSLLQSQGIHTRLRSHKEEEDEFLFWKLLLGCGTQSQGENQRGI